METVFIVLVVVVAVLLGFWAARQILGRRASAQPGPGKGDDPASALETEPAFEDAARLAGEGRYAEAIHALLLSAIRHFAERAQMPVQPCRTSRELVRLLPLGAEPREAFAELVRDVEVSLFGGASMSSENYERSLSSFRVLTRRLR